MNTEKLRKKCLNLVSKQFRDSNQQGYEGFKRVFNKWFDASERNQCARLVHAIMDAFNKDLENSRNKEPKTK